MRKNELIDFLIENMGKPKGVSWLDLANRYEIEGETDRGRAKRAFDYWRRFLGSERSLELKQLTLDKNGNVVSKKIGRGMEPKNLPSEEGLQLKFMTKTPNGGAYVRLEAPKPEALSKEEIAELVKSFIETPAIPIIQSPVTQSPEYKIYTIGDVHVGMDSKDNLFGMSWDKDKLMQRADLFLSHIEDCEAMIVFGGDITDGLDGMTTRKRHKLPQNLNNKEQLTVAKDFALKIIDGAVSKTGSKIKVVWCSNSNHGGILDFAIGVILKEIESRWGGHVEIHNQERFIDVYRFADKDILITHGYDEEYMPRGWGRFLGNNEVSFVEKMIAYYNVSKPLLLRFDQHVWHSCRQDKFTDVLCPSFSSQSSWVSINFASSYEGGFMKIGVGDSFKPEIIDF